MYPPSFLEGVLTYEEYRRWLGGKAKSHALGDRRRWSDSGVWPSVSGYNMAIHQAVLDSEGRDFYTGEELDWALLRPGVYDSRIRYDSKTRRRFFLRPSVDHVDSEPTDEPDFVICASRTNSCKSDLSVAELREFCELFLRGTA